MALLWCDGFDHYGTTTAKMLDGAWAQVASSALITTSNVRTGTYAMQFNIGFQGFARRVLGGAKTTVGVGAAWYFPALPTASNTDAVYAFNDADNNVQVTISIGSTGTLSAYRGHFISGTLLGTTATPVVVANAYQHIEAVVFFSQTVGTVEVRVNGVTVLSLSGLDTVASSLVECSQIVFALPGTSLGATISKYMDDVFAYDNTSSYNNTFIGDRRVLTLFPDANTATADWTAVGAASGYLCIDEANPNEDTDYITAATVGLVSQFGLQNLPAGISIVNAVVMVERARKTEAGTANTQVAVVSGASTSNGADKPLTEIYTYRQDVFQTDPATAAPFTPSAVDSLQFKVTRTA